MRLKNIKGKLVNKNVSKFLIDWDAKSRSKVQFLTKNFFRTYWKNDIVYEEFPVYGTRLKVDILNATKKIAIEVQGSQHYKYNPFFHSESRLKYLQGMKRDMQKREWLEMNSYNLIEIKEEEVPSLSKQFIEDNFNIFLY